MRRYNQTAVEWAMKVQEIILRAIAKKITWIQAASIIGISARQMRRWLRRYEEYGYDGLFDRRKGKESPRKVPLDPSYDLGCYYCNTLLFLEIYGLRSDSGHRS